MRQLCRKLRDEKYPTPADKDEACDLLDESVVRKYMDSDELLTSYWVTPENPNPVCSRLHCKMLKLLYLPKDCHKIYGPVSVPGQDPQMKTAPSGGSLEEFAFSELLWPPPPMAVWAMPPPPPDSARRLVTDALPSRPAAAASGSDLSPHSTSPSAEQSLPSGQRRELGFRIRRPRTPRAGAAAASGASTGGTRKEGGAIAASNASAAAIALAPPAPRSVEQATVDGKAELHATTLAPLPMMPAGRRRRFSGRHATAFIHPGTGDYVT